MVFSARFALGAAAMDEKTYWLALNRISGIGAVRFRALLDAFGSAAAAWAASPSELKAAGLSPAAVERLLEARSAADLANLPAELEQHGLQALTWDEPGYPRKLRELEQAPPVLYVRGTLQPEDEWAVAIVGTRQVTAYGRQVAADLAAFLARNGLTVVSGLARGVDAVAHQAALEAGGRTLAVMAHGLERVYPPEHRKLAQEICGRGALLSDYAVGTPPDSANFPPRNRIISGLSLAVVVVEAGQRSGALITAGFAAEQGREVFAVPGNIHAPQSAGTNFLIQRGAHPLLRFEELLEVLNLEMMTAHQTAAAALPADPTEARLYTLLGKEPRHLNELGAQAGLPIEQVSATLALMELKGLVRQVGGMSYVVRESQAAYQTGSLP
ncbi:MAG: DNA-processing protein DprA [Anaerolineales bacterium]|nr:DNA-processing protein DprA [Anaerolineales bacterium]MCW5855886.1 DNA-processing protein DprA [Anaerolineales bacterium]